MARKRKEISVAELLGGLTAEQARELAEAYNHGLGSGKSPEAWKQEQAQKAAPRQKEPKEHP